MSAIAASSFSIYAYEALKQELEQVECLQFIFTTPTFVPSEVTDKARRELREFHIPQPAKEKGFFGTEFEIRLKNKLTQRAIAKECADWIRRSRVGEHETVYAGAEGLFTSALLCTRKGR